MLPPALSPVDGQSRVRRHGRVSASNPAHHRKGVFDRGRPRILRRAPVVHGQDGHVSGLSQPAARAIVRSQVSENPAAAVEIHHERSSVRGRLVQPHCDGRRPGHREVAHAVQLRSRGLAAARCSAAARRPAAPTSRCGWPRVRPHVVDERGQPRRSVTDPFYLKRRRTTRCNEGRFRWAFRHHRAGRPRGRPVQPAACVAGVATPTAFPSGRRSCGCSPAPDRSTWPSWSSSVHPAQRRKHVGSSAARRRRRCRQAGPSAQHHRAGRGAVPR